MYKHLFVIVLVFYSMLISQSVSACTFCMATLNGTTLFGSNEDNDKAASNIWFLPAEEGKYGRVYLGYNDGFTQGGMNDKGLCFDGASTPKSNLKYHPKKKAYKGNLIAKIMEECATVDEVVKMVDEYQFTVLQKQGQLMFADASGDAVVIGGPGQKGRGIDIIRKKKNYMVLTNFFPSNPKKGGHPCIRHSVATQMFDLNSTPSIDNFVSILKAVHVEGNRTATVYSHIFDLNTMTMKVFYFHNYKEDVEFKLEDELKKGPHSYKIKSLFADTELPLVALAYFNDRKNPMALSHSQRVFPSLLNTNPKTRHACQPPTQPQ